MVRKREHAQVLEEWLDAIGHPDERLRDACADLVGTLTGSPAELRGALTRFGQSMGVDGWPLSEIASWIQRLGRLAGPSGDPLDQFSSGVALAEGWAHGFLFGVHLGDATDPLTGLVTLPVLRHRLREVQLQCEALTIPIEQAFCIVVIDTDMRDRPPLERDAALVVLADRTRAAFGSGETVAISAGRVLVLASHHDGTLEAMLELLDEVRSFPLLRASRVIGWIEELPDSATLSGRLDAFVMDIGA
jgi:hypothetical protein